MESFFGNKVGSRLALAALAACFLVTPGKAQNITRNMPEAPACTSYPEWSCDPQTMPAERVTSTVALPADGPSCTSYPEWSCEPEATPSQQRALAKKRQQEKASKLEAGHKVQKRKPNKEASGAADSLDESFKPRP